MFTPAADLNQSYQQAVYFTAEAPALMVATMGEAPGVDLPNCYSRISSRGRISVCDGQVRIEPLAARTTAPAGPGTAPLRTGAAEMPATRQGLGQQVWLSILGLTLLLAWIALEFQQSRRTRIAR